MFRLFWGDSVMLSPALAPTRAPRKGPRHDPLPSVRHGREAERQVLQHLRIAAGSAATPAAPAAPDATLPTNHPASAKQLKDFEKAQKRAEAQAKKKQKKAPAQPAPNPTAKP